MSGLDNCERRHLIEEALSKVVDPEIGRSVVELGLIYDIVCFDPDELRIVMTTTTRGCPAAGYLVEAVRERAQSTGVLDRVYVELTYDPPWTPEMMQP